MSGQISGDIETFHFSGDIPFISLQSTLCTLPLKCPREIPAPEDKHVGMTNHCAEHNKCMILEKPGTGTTISAVRTRCGTVYSSPTT